MPFVTRACLVGATQALLGEDRYQSAESHQVLFCPDFGFSSAGINLEDARDSQCPSLLIQCHRVCCTQQNTVKTLPPSQHIYWELYFQDTVTFLINIRGIDNARKEV